MQQQHYPTFTVTAQGILMDGMPLTKSTARNLPPQTLREIARIEELLKQVKKEEWDNPVPYAGGEYPALVKASMRVALLSPQPYEKFNPYHLGPGQGGGQFTTAELAGNSEGVTAADRKNPRFKGMTDTQIKKQKFVDATLDATEKAAAQLNVPVANILGVTALESKWGLGGFILDGPTVSESTNGYFGMHAPAPFMDGTTQIGNGPAAMAGFASYQDALNSFVARYGSMIQGVSDPTQFATILQLQGKFGIKDGGYDPTYIPDLASTIRNLASTIAYAKRNPK